MFILEIDFAVRFGEDPDLFTFNGPFLDLPAGEGVPVLRSLVINKGLPNDGFHFFDGFRCELTYGFDHTSFIDGSDLVYYDPVNLTFKIEFDTGRVGFRCRGDRGNDHRI